MRARRTGAVLLGELDLRSRQAWPSSQCPAGVGEPSETRGDSGAVRRAVRVRQTTGRYRPLAGARTLRRGWRFALPAATNCRRCIDEVYPLARRTSDSWSLGTLRVVPLDEVLRRQSGRYGVAAELDDRAGGRERALLCGTCVKTPVWRGDRSSTTGRSPVPSRAACSSRSAAKPRCGSARPPAPAEPDPAVAFAAFDEPGNELREALPCSKDIGHG